jgi:hypothetical protein
VECEEFSDEDEEVPDENAPENWETTDELEESSNEAEPSHGESDRGGVLPRLPPGHSKIFVSGFLSAKVRAEQQQVARKH